MRSLFILIASASIFLASCSSAGVEHREAIEAPPVVEMPFGPVRSMLESAVQQTKTTTGYTQDYFVIPYPNGDVPPETGACSDVVIRAFRAAGVDLQKELHEDIAVNFDAYPRKWGLAKPDTNIDHRRVPNIQKFFERRGKSLPVTTVPGDYRPGDVVSWDLNGKGMTHVGIVSNLRSANSERRLVFHNIGAGVKAEDRLFEWKVTGHYRYFD